MGSIDQLEAELERSGLAPDRLAVYADALQQLGDPRGELIALDLHVDQHGPSAELDARRRTLAAAWLGKRLASEPTTSHRYGFVDLEVAEVSTLRMTRYLAGVSIRSRPDVARAILQELVAARRPWLERLGIDVRFGTAQSLITAKLAKQLLATTPRLNTITVDGTGVLGRFTHPEVTRLRIDSQWALFLDDNSPPHVAVTEIDLVPSPSILRPRQFPALRRLDLRRSRGNATEIDSAFALTHLMLPALRTAEEIELAQQALDSMPTLEEIHVIRLPRGASPLRHAARLFVGESLPCPESIHQVARDGIAVTIAGEPPRVVTLVDAVTALHSNFHRLSSTARDAWRTLWPLIEATIGNSTPRPLPAGLLYRAIDEMDFGRPDYELQPLWARLRTALRSAGADAPVEIAWRYV